MNVFTRQKVTDMMDKWLLQMGAKTTQKVEANIAAKITQWLPPSVDEEQAALIGTQLKQNMEKHQQDELANFHTAFGHYSERFLWKTPEKFSCNGYDTFFRCRKTFPQESENGPEFVVYMTAVGDSTVHCEYVEVIRCGIPEQPDADFFNHIGKLVLRDIMNIRSCPACADRIIQKKQLVLDLGHKRMRSDYCNNCVGQRWSNPCVECGSVQGQRAFKRRRRGAQVDKTRCTTCAK